ncbi:MULTISPECIES: terminase small subunit [unclassified Pantoea]|uniref:terminase small subunit n=1 Tax=unclassified Pantoea TaxID=2630326 RepID=UPI00204B83F0|nr:MULTISPECIES: terminase small subunit [unclassified Pantoea]MDU5474007.1 terminase small subunit [Pantoea sp.]DAI70362.1 MAG TPA: Terminase small subunit [Bacteriophage sp.]
MAKPDWGALQVLFLAEHAKTGISPKEWCEARGLNYSSARRYIKKPAAQKSVRAGQRNIQSAQRSNSESAQPVAQEFDLRSYGLNDMQIRFVEEYLIDLNRTAAYKRAGYKGEGNTAYVNASRMLRNAKVAVAVRDAMDARARRTQITQDAVLQWWWDIATADATQLTELHRYCCRYCWGFGHNYQWRDAVEFEEKRRDALARKQREPSDEGGYGYDAQIDPNPECPRCNGLGLSRPVFHDTRDLTGAARRLFAGVKEGKFGLEIVMRNQDDALKMVAQHIGMVKTKTEISGPDGGPIQSEQVSLTPDQAADLYRKMMG